MLHRRLLVIFILSLVSTLLIAQQRGDCARGDSVASSLAETASLTNRAVAPAAATMVQLSDTTEQLRYGFSERGFLLQRVTEREHWENIPEECRIDWRRWWRKPLRQLYFDVGNFFGTFDTTYVHRNRYDFGITLNNVYFLQHLRFSAQHLQHERQTLLFAPAYIVKLGPQFTWKALSVGYTFGLMRDAYRQRTSEFNLALYNSKVGFDLNYTSSEGNFELQSMTGFRGVRASDLTHQPFGGIASKTFAVNAYYVLNYRHFSYPAAYSLSTLQLRSAGSWIAGFRFDRQHVSFDATEMEEALQRVEPSVQLLDELRISRVRYRQWSLSLGYGYNWVPTRGWLISATLAPSVGYKYQTGERFSFRKLRENASNLHADLILRLGLVWTNGQHYIGASGVSYFYNYRYNDFILNNNLTYLRVYVGYYFQRKKMFRRETWQQFAPWSWKVVPTTSAAKS